MSDPFQARLDRACAARDAEDYRLAFRLYLGLAMEGSVVAQRHVALMHDFGEGVPVCPARAARWYRMAAEQGSAYSQSNLGWCHEHGEDVPRDLHWYRLAALQGEEEPATRLVVLLGKRAIAAG